MVATRRATQTIPQWRDTEASYERTKAGNIPAFFMRLTRATIAGRSTRFTAHVFAPLGLRAYAGCGSTRPARHCVAARSASRAFLKSRPSRGLKRWVAAKNLKPDLSRTTMPAASLAIPAALSVLPLMYIILYRVVHHPRVQPWRRLNVPVLPAGLPYGRINWASPSGTACV